MLLPEHEKFHKMGPKEAGLKDTVTMDIARTTNQTGEQLHCQVPIYPEDTREQIKDRLNFFFSLIQDRLDDENKAVEAINARQQTIRLATEAMRRNNDRFQKQAKTLNKQLQSKKINQEQWDEAMKDTRAKLEAANKELQDKIKEITGDANEVQKATELATEQARTVEE